MSHCSLILASAFSILAFVSSQSASAQVTFERLASSAVNSPGGDPYYSTRPPALSNGRAQFISSPNSGTGIFQKSGNTYIRCASTHDASGYYYGFGSNTFSSHAHSLATSGLAAFRAYGSYQGLYEWNNGVVNIIMRTIDSVPMPGSSPAATFGGFSDPDFDPVTGLMAFAGGGGGQQGVYTSSPLALARIADRSTINPSTGQAFAGFSQPTIYNGVAAFVGVESGNTTRAICTSSGGAVTVHALTGDIAPGSSDPFVNFSPPAISAGGVTFFAQVGNSNYGLYTTIGGTLRRIVDTTQVYPGDSNPIFFGPPSSTLPFWVAASNGNRVSFIAHNGSTKSAVFLWDGASNALMQVIKEGDILDFGQASFFELHPQALDGTKVGFKVAISGGPNSGYAAYQADVPTVASGVSDWDLY